MIKVNRENIGAIIHKHGNEFTNVFIVMRNNQIIWRRGGNIQSCYGAGYWQDIYPWTDNTPWKDNVK